MRVCVYIYVCICVRACVFVCLCVFVCVLEKYKSIKCNVDKML